MPSRAAACSFFTIRDVLALYPALGLRLFLMSNQYRQAVNYTQRALEEVCCPAAHCAQDTCASSFMACFDGQDAKGGCYGWCPALGMHGSWAATLAALPRLLWPVAGLCFAEC